METQEAMLTSEDVANYLKVDVVTVRRLVSRGELAAYRVGSEFRFTESDLNDYLSRQYMPVNSQQRGTTQDIARSTVIAQDILQRLFGAKKTPKGSSPIGERFTERTRKALQRSQEAAEQQCCDHIYTSHLLVGLAEETGSMAGRALADLGVSPERIKSTLAEHPELTGPARETGDALNLDPDVKRALETAVAQAKKLSANHVGTEHVLLGLLNNKQNKASGVLHVLNVPLEAVRAKVFELITNAKA